MMKHLTFAVCGCGCRGTGLAGSVLCDLPDVTVRAVCDVYEDKAIALADSLAKKGFPRPEIFTNYKEMFTKCPTDAVLVSASWEAHVEISCAAMEHHIAVAMEVGGAANEEECRRLIAVYERTKTPFMLMENCCYNREELLATALARRGYFGEIVYCHGAYAHDLREEVAYGDINRHYRLRHYSARNCENYPTHELGPIARLLNITRGNRMVSLVSLSSKARGMHAYIEGKPELAALSDRVFAQGDIVETLITCEGGELISLRLDTTLPRFYSREFTVRGTKGLYNQDNHMVLLDGRIKEYFDTANGMEAYHNNAEEYAAFLPSIWQNTDEETLSRGHGGMDWFEFVAFVDALRAGEPMPIDVYDATAWMAVTYLSEQSIRQGGASVPIPDFTDGAWKTRPPKDVLPL